ncbi:hypothetical protein PCK1_000085 [Pneumocystis canis]|nr:hypothetical protein PCK1_000085 [Pneumocystis canis]
MTNQWPDYERDSSRHEDLPHRGAEGDYERPDRGANYDKQERSRSRSPNGRGSRNNDQDDVAAENPGTNLFISGIAPRMDEKELEEIFSRLGSVVKCSIVSDPYTKESRGFGFVTMATPEDADKAIEAANGQEHYGRVFSVEKARRGGPRVATPGTYMGPRRRGI